ncbi:Late embryogenesis abundantlike protein 1 putative [Phytophthora palmivora]|uniref:Late embryogenesis abundantlike protein 1 putative n=1 Tax=Phytophthora palmivora TaxID=4796 RepID=A0A2P4YBU4_9STRA|nr:Late embryogenesis abundantlike protein 1 putative [Phytophthora palmivora]
MVRMPTSMTKNKIPKEHSAKEAASETVDEMLSEAEKMRRRNDMNDRGRQTLEQLQEDARNLGEYARGKMDHMNEVMREAASSARESTGLPNSAPVPTDAISDTVMDSLKTASEKLSAEISELGERVESVKARVQQSMHTAGGKAKDTWYQSSEAAKNVGEREYCMPLPTNRICARHVAYFAIPLLVLFVMMMLRRRYPKKWNASVNKMKQPRMMLARETPSSDKLKSQLESTAENLEGKVDYAKQRGSAKMDEVRNKYGQPENKKDQ